jgi:hypothetical protein
MMSMMNLVAEKSVAKRITRKESTKTIHRNTIRNVREIESAIAIKGKHRKRKKWKSMKMMMMTMRIIVICPSTICGVLTRKRQQHQPQPQMIIKSQSKKNHQIVVA